MRPEADFHPLVKRAIAGLRERKDGELSLSPIVADRLRADLLALHQAPDLKPAVEDLVELAFFLEDKRQAATVAATLLDIANSACAALRAQAKKLADRAQAHKTQAAKSLHSMDNAGRPPQADALAPKLRRH